MLLLLLWGGGGGVATHKASIAQIKFKLFELRRNSLLRGACTQSATLTCIFQQHLKGILIPVLVLKCFTNLTEGTDSMRLKGNFRNRFSEISSAS